MRPSSVIGFERLFLAALTIGAVNTFALASRLPGLGVGLSATAAMVTIVIGCAVGVALMLLLWYFVARRGSVVAKWLTVAVAAYTLFSLLNGWSHDDMPGGALGMSVVLAATLQIVSVTFLFRPDARPWFATAREAVA